MRERLGAWGKENHASQVVVVVPPKGFSSRYNILKSLTNLNSTFKFLHCMWWLTSSGQRPPPLVSLYTSIPIQVVASFTYPATAITIHTTTAAYNLLFTVSCAACVGFENINSIKFCAVFNYTKFFFYFCKNINCNALGTWVLIKIIQII